MQLFTKEQTKKLLENGKNRGCNHAPVVRLFIANTGFTWLISEIDPENNSFAFGLCDLGMGFPELGSVYLPEILAVEGCIVESDPNFEGKYPISVYADAARAKNEITLDDTFLRLTQKSMEQ